MLDLAPEPEPEPDDSAEDKEDTGFAKLIKAILAFFGIGSDDDEDENNSVAMDDTVESGFASFAASMPVLDIETERSASDEDEDEDDTQTAFF
ncbi:MAG: hypothetical protein AAGA06_11695 [Pseudomonadota bacterium]